MVTRIKPYNPSANDLVADWHVIDADGEVLGRLASRIAWLLIGKHKPGYVPHLKSGDFVVVVNAEKVRVTGKKSQQIVYRRHSQYPGNLKEIPYRTMQEKHPTRIIEHAVRGMLPKSKLGDRMYTRLKVYAGDVHPHAAQVTGSQRRVEQLAELAARAAEEATTKAETASTEDVPKRRRRRRRRILSADEATTLATGTATTAKEAAADAGDAETDPAEDAPKRPRRRRRRTRSATQAAAVAAGETGATPAKTQDSVPEAKDAIPEADNADSDTEVTTDAKTSRNNAKDEPGDA